MRTILLLACALVAPLSLRGQTHDDTRSFRARAALSALVDEGFRGSGLVSRGDSILFHGRFGVGEDSSTVRYWVASLTKGLTAIAVLKLAEDGVLSIDDPLSRYLPDVPSDKSEITLFHLLTHQSGIPNGYASEGISSRDSAASAILAVPLEHEPGAGFTYTNDGYSLLAIVIELATGTPYTDVMKASITDPLGLQEIAFWHQPARPCESMPPLLSPWPRPESGVDWGFLGGHGARLSVAELNAIGAALMRGGLLTEESLDLLFGPHRSLSSGLGVGMGWFSETDEQGRRLRWARGYDTSGANALLYLVGDDLVIVAATNAGPSEDVGPGWSRRVRDALLEIYAPS